MATASERQMQSALLGLLAAQGYTNLPPHKTIEQHEPIFRSELDRLNGCVLSDTEYNRLMPKLKLSMEQAFSTFRHGVELAMDDGSTRLLKFYDTKDQSRNHFQVAEEVKIEGVVNRRLDVVVFMNGLPVVAGELKKTGSSKGVDAALDDINVYSKEGVYRAGLLRFVQLYFASDGVTTKYFATNLGAERQEPYTNAFYWSDRTNKRILRLNATAQEPGWSNTFFAPESLFHLLHFNMLMTSGRDKRIIVLRPYQFYAVEDGVYRVTQTDGGGFFWHATGSGKTLTSFMLSQAILSAGKHSKVVMLLDRNDLANQTIEEYASFGGAAGDVSKGRDLTAALMDKTQPFVLTTMQSMAALLKKRYKVSKIKALLEEPIVIVVDECHRSTFGDQFKHIRRMFPHAQLIGFTGTPILDENSKTNDGRLTKDLFGEPIHIYTTKDAIDDGNVLPFKEYEVDLGGRSSDPAVVKTPAWKQAVADYIAENLFKHTQQRNLPDSPMKDIAYDGGYTALLAAPFVRDAFEYWTMLTPMLRAQGRTCVAVFSGVADEGKDNAANGTDWHSELYKDYDSQFGTSFAKDEDPDVLKKYLADLTRRIKNKEIDLVIVANMLLTGFDAKTLNTVYLDKDLQWHGLVQAMSRGNRVYKDPSKAYGNVVLFKQRHMKDKVDDAIRLFSNGRSVEGVVERKPFAEAFAATVSAVSELRVLAPTPSFIDVLEEVRDLLPVARSYTAVQKTLRLLKTYDEWENTTKDYAKLGVSEQEVDEYYGFLLEAKRRILNKEVDEGDSEVAEDFELEIRRIATYNIDVAYINELLRNAIFAPPAQRQKWVEKVKTAVARSEDPDVVKNAGAILETVNEIEGGRVTTEVNVFKDLEARKARLRQAKILIHSDELKISEAELETLVRHYELSGESPVSEYNRMLASKGCPMAERRELKGNLGKIMQDLSLR